MTVQRTRIKTQTQISNHFLKILKIDCTCSKIALKFGNLPKSTGFRMSIEHFPTFFQIDSIIECSVSFDMSHDYIWGSQTLKSEYSRNIRLKKNSFEIHWPMAIKCPLNQNFMKIEKKCRLMGIMSNKSSWKHFIVLVYIFIQSIPVPYTNWISVSSCLAS